MGDGITVHKINQWSAAVIGVILIALGVFGFIKGKSVFNWLNPGWQLYFVFFGILFFLYFHDKNHLKRNWGFMCNNFTRGILCLLLAANIGKANGWGDTFNLIRKIGFWALIVNLVICIIAIFFPDSDTSTGDASDFKLCD